MNLDAIEKLANAVLYEGYILYPYRPSSVKNQKRFNFGVLVPAAYSAAENGAEAYRMHTECLVQGDPDTLLTVEVRFLQPARAGSWMEALERVVGPVACDLIELTSGPDSMRKNTGTDESVPSRQTEINEIQLPPVDRSVCPRVFPHPAKRVPFNFPLMQGTVELTALCLREGLYRVTVTVSNESPIEDAELQDRDRVLPYSCASTHTILAVEGGAFVSLLEPPDELQEAASQCRNVGTWPILAGKQGDTNLMLSSPIILYDYAEIAPESAGDMFDGSEIDEILTLRILTMTDEEKREMRESDERGRRLLERTESLPKEHLMRLHGTLRELQPGSWQRK